MPIYVDAHPFGTLDRVALGRALDLPRGAAGSVAGVRALDHYFGSGCLFCVAEAPSVAAVRQQHAALGLPCADIRLVRGLPAPQGLDPAAWEALRQCIVATWPHSA